MMFLDES
jgi:hypothetical protein